MGKHAAGHDATAPIAVAPPSRTRRRRTGLLTVGALGLSLASGVAGAAAMSHSAAPTAPSSVAATPTPAQTSTIPSAAAPVRVVDHRAQPSTAARKTTTRTTPTSTTTARPKASPSRRAAVSTTCDLSGPPVFGDPAHPNTITNRDCGYVDAQGRARSRDSWIDDQLTSAAG